MPVHRPMRLAFVASTSLLLLATSCSDDTPAGRGGDDTTLDGAGGDLNTDLFAPGDGGGDDTDGEVGADTGTETGGEGLGRYEACGFGGLQCEPPLICAGTCQLPCTAGCPTGEECISVGGMDAFGVCGVRGDEGDPCDFTQGQFCEDGLNCVGGECTAPQIGGEDTPCGGLGQQCGEGLVCVFTGFGEGICRPTCGEGDPCDEGEVCVGGGFGTPAACFEDCDLETSPECSDNVTYQCREPLGGGDEACLPRLGEPPGDAQFGEACSRDVRCAEGLFCPRLQGGYCTQTCGNDAACPSEPPGATCVNLFLQGICAFTCPGGSPSECPEGMACNDVFGQRLCAWP
jgi:hypothetical protein